MSGDGDWRAGYRWREAGAPLEARGHRGRLLKAFDFGGGPGTVAGEVVRLELENGSIVEVDADDVRPASTPRPELVGVPTDGPRCPWCKRRLKYETVDELGEVWPHARPIVVRRVFKAWRQPYGAFDRLACALDFAQAALAAGYRRKA